MQIGQLVDERQNNAELALSGLPLVGSTVDVNTSENVDYWQSIFGGIWGPVQLTEIGGDRLSGSLHSRHVGELTFNRIEFGNQIFECLGGHSAQRAEPFYSLTFPQSGSAKCYVGRTRMSLVPNHAYLINVDSSAKLRVDSQYTTLNIQIPVSCLEHRLGTNVEIMPRSVLRPDPIYSLIQRLMSELTESRDENTTAFLTKQMIDTVAFFLAGGANGMSQDTVAVQSVRARVLNYLDANFRNAALSPYVIAKECGISRSYLYKVFADGPTIMEHLRRRRLDAARDMIQTRRQSTTLTAVAMSCGFSSSSEFSRLHKKTFGIKPSDY